MTSSSPGGWQFWIDRGGSFTDVVARSPAGRLITLKLLSEDPAHYRDGGVAGIRRILSSHGSGALPRIDCIKMGTTVATNALLERQGAPTALVITRGFGDALRIGYQNRPELFARHIRLPELLYCEVIEAIERIDAAGSVLEPLDLVQLRRDLQRVRAAGIASVAIVFMHSYRHPEHERRAAALARELGFSQVSASHELMPMIRLVSRGDTAVVDAYLSPMLGRYVEQLRGELERDFGAIRWYFMQSNGGLTDAGSLRGMNSILSGPAGGLVGMVKTATQAGFTRLIGFDMGGTSTDVCLYDGRYPRRFDNTIAGVRLNVPMMNIHTVAAGGGSILRYSSGRFQVGPQSAGAAPGPACYGRGGPLTVTDINVLLGRLQAEFFPAILGASADQPLDAAIVQRRFQELAQELARDGGPVRSPEQIAEGFLRVAIATMANAIKHVSVRQGYDAADYTLGCFGGAAGQHACLVAQALGIRSVLIHPLASLLSAYGIGLADIRTLRRQSVEAPFDSALLPTLTTAFSDLSDETARELHRQGFDAAAAQFELTLELRVTGADAPFTVPFGTLEQMRSTFDRLHRQQYGFEAGAAALTVASIACEAIIANELPAAVSTLSEPQGASTNSDPLPARTARVRFSGVWREVPVYTRDRLRVGARYAGPALIVEPHSTVVLEPQASTKPASTSQGSSA